MKDKTNRNFEDGNYEDGEFFHSDILGQGNYTFIGADSGKSAHKAAIGFVRPKPESLIQLVTRIGQPRKK